MNESVTASLELFTSFGARVAEGLSDRVEGGAAATEPQTGPIEFGPLAASIAEGALLLHAIWGNEGQQLTGAVVWTGSLSILLGEDAKPVSDLSEEDTAALGDSLRLNAEEGGDGPIPVDWTAIERITADELPAKLAAMGIGDGADGAEIAISLGEGAMRFVFLVGPPRAEEEAGEAEEESVSEVDADVEATEDDARPVAGPAVAVTIPEHLLDVRLPLSIRLGSTNMNLEEILRLSPGAIVELDQREDEPLEVVANGKVVARGEVVVVDERFGLKITEIGSPADRIGAV